MTGRREFLTVLGASAITGAATVTPGRALAASGAARTAAPGRLRQSVCRWPFSAIPLPDFCRAVADLGLGTMDPLLGLNWSVRCPWPPGTACPT